MATKVTLIDISSGFKGTDIQTNFTSIEDEFDKVVYRDGTSPNQMTDDLDLNSNKIVNLGAPVNNSDAMRLQDVTDDAKTAKATAVTIDDTAGDFSSDNVEGALAEFWDSGTRTTPSFTVSGLPTAGTAARVAYASDGRKNGETAGNGSGVLVFDDGTNWIAVDTGQTVAA